MTPLVARCTNKGCKGEKRPLYYRGKRTGDRQAPFLRAGLLVYCPECGDIWDDAEVPE